MVCNAGVPLLLASCASGRPIGVHAETADLEEAVRDAVAYYTNCGDAVELGGDVPVRFGSLEGGYSGETFYSGSDPSRVVIETSKPWMTDEERCGRDDVRLYLSRVVTHEVGHVLGYRHVNDALSVMIPITIGCEMAPPTCPGSF